MEILQKIPLEQMGQLRDIYNIGYPLHISTFSTVQMFIERFAQHPDWIDKVSFLSLGDDWRRNGTFVMIYETRIFCNTLEEYPFKSLRKLLLMIELDNLMTFVNLRDYLRSLVLDVIRIRYFEVVSDIGTTSFLMPKDALNNLIIETQEGFELKPLTTDHVKKINDVWAGKYSASEKFIEDAIKYNQSMGLFDKNGELLSWNMRMDNGSMGVGQVDPNFSGNLYGQLAVIALAVKIAKDCNTDVHFEIRNGNLGAQKQAGMAQLQIIDTQSWINIRKKKQEAIPMWGHL